MADGLSAHQKLSLKLILGRYRQNSGVCFPLHFEAISIGYTRGLLNFILYWSCSWCNCLGCGSGLVKLWFLWCFLFSLALRRTFWIELRINKVELVIAYEIVLGGFNGLNRCVERWKLAFIFFGILDDVCVLERHRDQHILFGCYCGNWSYFYVGIIFRLSFRFNNRGLA